MFAKFKNTKYKPGKPKDRPQIYQLIALLTDKLLKRLKSKILSIQLSSGHKRTYWILTKV